MTLINLGSKRETHKKLGTPSISSSDAFRRSTLKTASESSFNQRRKNGRVPMSLPNVGKHLKLEGE